MAGRQAKRETERGQRGRERRAERWIHREAERQRSRVNSEFKASLVNKASSLVLLFQLAPETG